MDRIVHSFCFLTDVSSIRYIVLQCVITIACLNIILLAYHIPHAFFKIRILGTVTVFSFSITLALMKTNFF